MSVKITKTCIPKSKAKYSAQVSAIFGVNILSIDESLDKFSNITTLDNTPLSSKLFL